MSTLILCGTKRSYFEDIPSLPSTKRFRCSNAPSWSSPSSSLDQLRTAFPNLELTVLVKALEEHGNDLNTATKSLYSLVSSEEEKKAEELGVNDKTTFTASNNLPKNGDEWVELLVKEVLQPNGTYDDAKVRVAKVLEVLEKTLSEQTREQVTKKFQEENVATQQQFEALIKDNTILKRAVAIQHERQKAFDETNQELNVLKQMIPQYQEKLRNLEVNNYALRMHIQQLEHGNSMPTRFNPHVF